MAKRNKKNQKVDLKEWLLGFEKQIGKPVIVSLLIEKGEYEFISCVRKKVYLGEEDDDVPEPGDDSPSVDFKKVRKNTQSCFTEWQTYIG